MMEPLNSDDVKAIVGDKELIIYQLMRENAKLAARIAELEPQAKPTTDQAAQEDIEQIYERPLVVSNTDGHG